ncbi:breast cancer anti-estrogen resistance protein 3 homolog isoform X3 [Sardina pilchardus]
MESLRKELEEELKLNTDDIRSHAWYHGEINREDAEALLERDGDFLIRNSNSSPHDYVLSCRWKDGPMHFKIIRVVLRPKKGYTRELFQFEDDQFDNIPALVRFHVGGRLPISHGSGAVIFHPITRTLPLRVIRERQAAKAPRDHSKRRSLSSTHMDMLQVNNNNLLRSGSQPANLENVGRPSLQSAQSDSNLRTGVPPINQSPSCGPAPISPVFRTGSEPLLSPRASKRPGQSPPSPASCASPSPSGSLGGVTLRGSDGQLHSRAPPKPLRVSALFPPANNAAPPPSPSALAAAMAAAPSSRSRQDPSCFYDVLVPQIPPSMLPRGHAARLRAEEKWQSRARLTETSFGFLETTTTPPLLPPRQLDGSAETSTSTSAAAAAEDEDEEEAATAFVRPREETESSFRLGTFESLLLPEGNKPLEQAVLMQLKELFSRVPARTTALHMLSVDCQVARITGVTMEQRRMMGVNSGLELITLPHGSQLRQDLLERHHLISLGIAVDLLGCTGTVGQRATVLHKIIQLAEQLKTGARDLYAFSAIMAALEMPQVTRLEMTWRALRRNHTDSAVLFEKTHKPFMKALNEGDDSVVSGPVAVPHIVPLLRLMEGEEPVEHADPEKGCGLLYSLLQAARSTAVSAAEHQQHASSLLSAGWEPIPELLEAFRTEFALRLFWGQSGAEAERQERYEKFDKILTVLSSKLEPLEVPTETL